MEIHFHGPLLARDQTPRSDSHAGQQEEQAQEQETDDGGGRSTALPALLALVVLVALGYAVRRLRAENRQTTLDEQTD